MSGFAKIAYGGADRLTHFFKYRSDLEKYFWRIFDHFISSEQANLEFLI